jgi:hypothetical protein
VEGGTPALQWLRQQCKSCHGSESEEALMKLEREVIACDRQAVNWSLACQAWSQE